MAASVGLEAALKPLYERRWTPAEFEAKARLWKVLYDGFLSRYVPADAAVADLGAGYCHFINQVRAARRIAIDLNPDTASCAAEGVEVIQTPIEQFDAAVGPASIDLAFASNVFEHLRGPDALLAVLAAVHRALRPDGRLLILQPNIRWVREAFWDFIDHTLPLTERGMAEALRVSGFEVVECRSKFLPYSVADRRLPLSETLARLYLRLPPAQWVFGKQMFLVARRVG
jgi:SAM-dependent methyltransferase